jgi:5'-deoxynucleotidase YfbR-like HD superfamily hydrolase
MADLGEARPPHPRIDRAPFLKTHSHKRLGQLLDVPRFQGAEMTQRTSVLHHTLRVTGSTAIISEILLEAGTPIDQFKAMYMADMHDDPERSDPAGDIPTPVKRQWTDEERRKFKEREIEAIRNSGEELDIPSWVESAADLFTEYREGQTLEARVVNYLDKWDAVNEVTHELVAGDNQAEFAQILERYRAIMAELETPNSDWLPIVRDFLGTDVFTVPNLTDIHKKTVQDLSFESSDSLISSLCKDNPQGYFFWIALNRVVHNINFLDLTFPGWVEQIPPQIQQAIEAVKQRKDFLATPSGLIIASGEATKAMNFAREMNLPYLEFMLESIRIAGFGYRARTGRTRVPHSMKQ